MTTIFFGVPSASGNSSDSSTGSQKRRSNSPMPVPAPLSVRNLLSSARSMGRPPGCYCFWPRLAQVGRGVNDPPGDARGLIPMRRTLFGHGRHRTGRLACPGLSFSGDSDVRRAGNYGALHAWRPDCGDPQWHRKAGQDDRFRDRGRPGAGRRVSHRRPPGLRALSRPVRAHGRQTHPRRRMRSWRTGAVCRQPIRIPGRWHRPHPRICRDRNDDLQMGGTGRSNFAASRQRAVDALRRRQLRWRLHAACRDEYRRQGRTLCRGRPGAAARGTLWNIRRHENRGWRDDLSGTMGNHGRVKRPGDTPAIPRRPAGRGLGSDRRTQSSRFRRQVL